MTVLTVVQLMKFAAAMTALLTIALAYICVLLIRMGEQGRLRSSDWQRIKWRVYTFAVLGILFALTTAVLAFVINHA